MREKLSKLGLDLPTLPTTAVGSYPKPAELKKARRKFLKGELKVEDLRPLEEKATREWIKIQEDVGLDVLVDGEMYRGDMVTYFARNLEGFSISGLVRSYDNRYYRKPVIKDKIEWTKPITVDYWRYAQELTEKPVKGVLTGPYTMMDWSFNEYYPNRKEACLALARALRKEVEVLADAGAKIIQIDEPASSARPEELPEFSEEAMKIMTNGIDAYFITHICYGAFEFIYPEMLSLSVDNFDLEMSNSDLDLVELFEKKPFTKDISFGVIDVHSHVIEDEDTVKSRIERALETLDTNQVWIDPDCGLKTRTKEETIEKLKVLVNSVKETRKNLD
ncbi:methionine synthase [candidate division MSBL1 archaeon SCGC-AAA261F17]|uniref:Methionine synthase n=1 Tax=candidate division MSBL1 archaeon SCGC-AAA261F17 TaxID=1698274 RepID=A0A133V671_9EURY|nr:methionine synthase [candidate division MSBL1 archaeon SCGC-AAA261F17]